jgi:radical SAM-linked protein
MIRLFKRAFNRSGIFLEYSEGFNPHPKMSFAQPLSLGYTASGELLEFDTKEAFAAGEIKKKMNSNMPGDIRVLDCVQIEKEKRSLAAKCCAAEYRITIPCSGSLPDNTEKAFMAQENILVLKKSGKRKAEKQIDIRKMIRSLNIKERNNNIILSTILDAGSNSNLSPELLIKAFVDFAGIEAEREDIEVHRVQIFM